MIKELAYIKIRKGEPTNFNDNVIRIDLSDIKHDMTNWQADFKLGTIELHFTDFATDKYLDLNFVTPEDFNVGIMYGHLRLTDNQDRKHTIDIEIPFKVLEKIF